MKVCIVGVGARIAAVSKELKQAKPDFTFAAYVDPAPAAIHLVEEINGAPLTSYDDLAIMLAEEKPDVLLIGSPNFLHLEHLKAARESDTPKIFCEKPVVISEEETFQLLDLMQKHNGHERVMVGLVLRYSPLYVALREAQANGQLGEVVSIEASEHIGPYHGSFFMRDWRRFTSLSGGFMLEKCCHDLDLYQGLVGARPAKIASFGGRRIFRPENRPADFKGFPQPDTARSIDPFSPRWNGGASEYNSDGDLIDHQTALIEYSNGSQLCFHTNMFVPDEFRRFAVIGTKGMAEGDFIRGFFKVHDAFSGSVVSEKETLDGEQAGHYGADQAMARDLVAHLERGEPLPVSVVEALEAGLTALKLDQARNSGAVIDMTQTWDRFDAYLSN
ncbi:Gfo/Idh/MocA family oxidoreductase [Rhodobacteraceae bacterium RKSG542]|uniref:Gfo/Idh/MocA family protein n=1 Tax=Pseudovibrio flavus TaxID=2529854 RepID=UPI0012BCFE1E|nr:Gfo/Idh/MocA family oxidoreductase [Pseudovibrio flavus]MTI18077.1 Gfo/Idh/MocA family oxidoreductase [Pseudovibrio flavus]